MASMDEISIVIKGIGGHGAAPHQSVDPVIAGATAIVVLQQLISRMNNPAIPSVLSFGKIQSNGTFNVIPDEVLIEGTFRTMDENWRSRAIHEIEHITKSIAEGLGCTSEINIRKGYPSLFNNVSTADMVSGYMEEYLEKQHVVEHDLWMASEDFAYYPKETDAFFYLLGVGKEGFDAPSLHTSQFDINEDALETGMGLMTYITLRYLGCDLESDSY